MRYLKRFLNAGHLAACILGLAVIAGFALSASGDVVRTSDGTRAAGNDKIVGAFVRYTRDTIPDPSLMTHLYYAFGIFTDTDGHITVRNPERFEKILALRAKNPALKIVLCIGEGPEEGFSEMAASSKKRKTFANECKALMKRYGLAGITLDWEFPTTTRGGHTAAPDDAENYVKVMEQLRKTLGKNAELSFYSNNGAAYVDIAGMLPYVDYVMVSGYNLGLPPKHQSNLYSSEACGDWSVDKSVRKHISAGVPAGKILLGIPFYARKADGMEVDRDRFDRYLPGRTEVWDDEAKAPYFTDADGNMTASFDNERSLGYKAGYIRDHGLAGAFYWHYDNDDSRHTMARTLHGLLR